MPSCPRWDGQQAYRGTQAEKSRPGPSQRVPGA